MTARRPSRLALALLDRFVADNEPLKGDLLEEFEARRSHWWLWRQVIGALVCARTQRSLRLPQNADMAVLGMAMLLLVSFEAVFVMNVVHRLAFGPPLPDITGYFHLVRLGALDSTAGVTPPPLALVPALCAVAASMPAGWLIAQVHQQHRALSVCLFTLSLALCAGFNLRSPLPAQLVTMMVFVIGLLGGSRLGTAIPAPRQRS